MATSEQPLLTTLDRVFLYVGVLAVISLVISVFSAKRFRDQHPDGGVQKTFAGIGTGIGTIQVANIKQGYAPAATTGCYVDEAWLPVQSVNDRFLLSNTLNTAVTITFNTTTAVIQDESNNSVSSVSVSQQTLGGPFHVAQSTVDDCKNKGTATSCYIKYDIKVSGTSCESNGANYFTGVQVTR